MALISMILWGRSSIVPAAREKVACTKSHTAKPARRAPGAGAVARPDRGVEPDRRDADHEAPQQVRRHDRPARRLHVLHRRFPL
jgi:hypothetical protein